MRRYLLRRKRQMLPPEVTEKGIRGGGDWRGRSKGCLLK